MKEPLKRKTIEWEGWHGIRRGLATNLERIDLRETIAAMILSHTNDCVTRKHSIKPPSIEAIYAMRRLSETLLTLEASKLLPNCPPEPPQVAQGMTKRSMGPVKRRNDLNVSD